jgi:UDPglucose 6-dehydrogenase
MKKKTISIFGLGRVGLVLAVCLAKKGYKVIGIDTDQERLEQIQNARPPFFEPTLSDYLKEAVTKGHLLATEDPDLNCQCDVSFISVDTPGKPDGTVNLTPLRKATSAIGKSLKNHASNQLVVVRSTVLPGTARNIVEPILEKESGKTKGKGFMLCSNPELFRQGNAIYDTEHPDRIIIGGDEHDTTRLESFYVDFYGEHVRSILFRTTYENAELIKYANSAFIGTKISFINCIANIAEKTPHTDIKAVAAGIGLDPRIGPGALNPGFGWGGACLPKDLRALITYSQRTGYRPGLLNSVVETNEKQIEKAVRSAKSILGTLRGKRIAVLGLSFKPETDDMRDAISIPIIKTLLAQKAKVIAHDPIAMENARRIFKNTIAYANNPLGCIDQADCCIIVTEWNQFKTISADTFVEKMRSPIVIDGRRIYDPDTFLKRGVQLVAIGLGPKA